MWNTYDITRMAVLQQSVLCLILGLHYSKEGEEAKCKSWCSK